MSWVQLDDNFPNHPKAVQAGPVAAYLFVCGLCYCRKHHTGGFIPAAAVKLLGVTTNPRRMVDALIEVGLWERASGGFQVHDYREHYDDQEAKAINDERRIKKREAGRLGGRASWLKRQVKQNVDSAEAETKQPAEASAEALRVQGSGSGSSVALEKKEERRDSEAPLDEWLRAFQRLYPRNRVTSGAMTEHAFVDVFEGDPRPAVEVWAEMQANLATNIRSHEWRVKGYIPKLENYLLNGLWRQVHAEHPPQALVSDKTARTLSAAQSLMQGKP